MRARSYSRLCISGGTAGNLRLCCCVLPTPATAGVEHYYQIVENGAHGFGLIPLGAERAYSEFTNAAERVADQVSKQSTREKMSASWQPAARISPQLTASDLFNPRLNSASSFAPDGEQVAEQRSADRVQRRKQGAAAHPLLIARCDKVGVTGRGWGR